MLNTQVRKCTQRDNSTKFSFAIRGIETWDLKGKNVQDITFV